LKSLQKILNVVDNDGTITFFKTLELLQLDKRV